VRRQHRAKDDHIHVQPLIAARIDDEGSSDTCAKDCFRQGERPPSGAEVDENICVQSTVIMVAGRALMQIAVGLNPD
jgi:hypothetical protein